MNRNKHSIYMRSKNKRQSDGRVKEGCRSGSPPGGSGLSRQEKMVSREVLRLLLGGKRHDTRSRRRRASVAERDNGNFSTRRVAFHRGIPICLMWNPTFREPSARDGVGGQ
jgi:hypothetical protein